MNSRTVVDWAGNGTHMRTVNGGTPERIRSPKAVQEVEYARVLELAGAPVEVTPGKDGHSVRIDYHDVRGTVELRPTTGPESVMLVKPERERYAHGDRVIVRGTFYRHEERRSFVLPEYEGTIVNWTGGGYSVRAVNPDEDGTTHGVRVCQVRELRPVEPAVEPRSTSDDVLDGSRDARIHLTRMDASDATRCVVTAEQARVILGKAGHVEWADGREGFRFRTNHLVVMLSAMYANGNLWQERMDEYEELFNLAGWIVEYGRGFHGAYLRLTSSYGEMLEATREATRRLVEAAHVEALAENAKRNGGAEGVSA